MERGFLCKKNEECGVAASDYVKNTCAHAQIAHTHGAFRAFCQFLVRCKSCFGAFWRSFLVRCQVLHLSSLMARPRPSTSCFMRWGWMAFSATSRTRPARPWTDDSTAAACSEWARDLATTSKTKACCCRPFFGQKLRLRPTLSKVAPCLRPTVPSSCQSAANSQRRPVWKVGASWRRPNASMWALTSPPGRSKVRS